jgi:aspartate carbamoyltransferase catalytic subunit
MFAKKHLISIKDLNVDEISHILDQAKSMKEIFTRDIKKVPTLRGKTVINLFFEASTRTRVSFEIAAKRLSADIINFSAQGSSTQKGETLLDTVKNLEAMNPDIIVLRHSASGACHMISRYTKSSVVNAGDGINEHPTQCLLDMLTVLENKGKIEGINLSIIGDIEHSRVCKSNIYGFTTMGAHVTLCGPASLIPKDMGKLPVKITYNLREAIQNADVIMLLRIQKERMHDPRFPTLREYSKFYGIDTNALQGAKKDAIIMHPGPINRGVELSEEVADSARSVILNQVTNGIAVRMAVLYLLGVGAGVKPATT